MWHLPPPFCLISYLMQCLLLNTYLMEYKINKNRDGPIYCCSAKSTHISDIFWTKISFRDYMKKKFNLYLTSNSLIVCLFTLHNQSIFKYIISSRHFSRWSLWITVYFQRWVLKFYIFLLNKLVTVFHMIVI